MDKGEINLIDVMLKAVQRNTEMYSKPAKVDSYDEETETVDVSPLDDTAPVLGVKLVAQSGEANFLQVPKVGSFVIVTFLSAENAFVSICSDLETVKIRGDQFGGLIKIEELRNQLDIVTARIDTLYDAIKNGVPASGSADGGTAYQTSMKAILSAQVQTEDFSNIENESVKHG